MKIDFASSRPPLAHTWRRCFGQGRAGELLRADFLEHLALAKKTIGLDFLRFHGLFHDEMTVVTRRKDGSLCFHWQMIDRIFDALLDLGIRPFVELGPMPQALASGDKSIFHWKMNVTPPSDFAEWGQLVESLARHCVQRYGLDEVRKWYFEVWNEPNLEGFWSGSQEEYWELYRQAALAVKRVDSGLRIGGPATAQARWIPELIAFCQTNSVPLDFVSTHSYLQDEPAFYPGRVGSPHAPSEYLLDQFRRIKTEVAESAWPDLEIHWTEWNSLSADETGHISWTENPRVDCLYSGSFALHQAVRADALCDSQSWWVISDIFGEDGISPLPYSNTYGLINSLGIPKPAFHTFKWLSRMRGEQLSVQNRPSDSAYQTLVTREENCLRALIWFHPPVEAAHGEWTDSLELELDQAMILTRAHLAIGTGSGYEAWQAWGMPANLTATQEESLRFQSQPRHETSRSEAGRVAIPFTLQPYEVLFLEWTPAEEAAEARGIFRASRSALEDQLADLTKESA